MIDIEADRVRQLVAVFFLDAQRESLLVAVDIDDDGAMQLRAADLGTRINVHREGSSLLGAAELDAFIDTRRG